MTIEASTTPFIKALAELHPDDEPDGPAWRAFTEAEPPDGEAEEALGEGATPLEALDDCFNMATSIENGEDPDGENEEESDDE